MRKHFFLWIEQYLYNPTRLQKCLSTILVPFSILYCLYMRLRYLFSSAKDLGVLVVSVGNLTVGGSGKTPLTIALAKRYEDIAIVLRGYGRMSHGLQVVSDGKEILCDVTCSGDEAMIYALKVPNAIVIVSERREDGIKKAKAMGAKLVFLDDGYSKHHIKKLDLLIEVTSKNSSCLPSGPYRERLWRGKKVEILQENMDFTRSVDIENGSDSMALVTAIARPQRLDAYLPEVVGKYYFEDHHFFTKDELEGILQDSGATSLLVTFKDYVKIKDFGITISILDLKLDVKQRVFELIDDYITREGR